jgi:phage terminase large subunit-like protein
MNAQSQPAKIARQYAEQVVAGEILACEWVQRACQRQLDDLAKFKGKAEPIPVQPQAHGQGRSGASSQPTTCARSLSGYPM